jgi:UDP-GlcNAc:undecaprenyl-phosphate/decaprenyl-phosphate GlcNAc-1-phosphate transferase
VHPRSDRWHRKPVAQFGGIAIIIAFVAAAGLSGIHARLLAVVGLTVVIAAIGFCDDVRSWRPITRLILEFAIAAATVSLGLVYPLRSAHWINICFTLAWIVGITNAFNLLDNMDGLAAGIGIIAGIILSLLTPDAHLRLLTLVFVGAIGGFLIFNFKPAKIFMGDTGSLAIGYYLASASLLATEHLSTVSSILFVPVLVLFIPVFDTILVSVTRRINGRAISAGARDHTSHRLVLLGISERKAVLLLYGLAALSGTVAVLSKRVWTELGWGVLGLFLLAATLFWLHLARLKLPDEYLSRTNVFVLALPALIQSFATTAGAVLLDTGSIVLSLYLAILLRFGHFSVVPLSQYLALCCIALVTKIPPLALFGVYRWRAAVSLRFAYVILKSAIVGSLAFVTAVVFWNRFDGLSRAVFVIDLLLTCVLLLGVRVSDWFFEKMLRPATERPCLLVDLSNSKLPLYFEQVDARYELAAVIFADHATWSQQLATAIARLKPEAIFCAQDCASSVRSQVAEIAEASAVRCFEIGVSVNEVAAYSATPKPVKAAVARGGQ